MPSVNWIHLSISAMGKPPCLSLGHIPLRRRFTRQSSATHRPRSRPRPNYRRKALITHVGETYEPRFEGTYGEFYDPESNNPTWPLAKMNLADPPYANFAWVQPCR